MTSINRSGAWTAGLLLSVSSAFQSGHADEARCKPVLAAELKYVTTPNHTISTSGGFAGAGTGAVQRHETINTGRRRFVLVDGAWRVNPLTDAQVLQLEISKRGGLMPTCQALREESIDGEPATLYLAHNVTPDSTWDEQIWISNRSHLPLKVVVDFRADGRHDVDYISSRIFYADVRAPAGLE